MKFTDKSHNISATQTTKVADIARLSLKGSPVSVGVEEKKKEVATVQKLEQVSDTCWKFVLTV